MRIRIVAAVTALAASVLSAPVAAASAASFCGEIGGQWDGQYCRTSVASERKAVRDIKIAIPEDLVDGPVSGAVVRDYLSTLMDNWRSVAVHMIADSFGEENFQTFDHGNLRTVVFRETYHADGPRFSNAYRTFTFDMAGGRQVQLADLLKPGATIAAIPALAEPYIVTALDQAPPQHQPGSYPFIPERWTPDKVYSGGYKAWALTPDQLILYMPDYPVARDTPIDFTPGMMQWSMDGGTVEAHIPLAALSPILQPGYGGS